MENDFLNVTKTKKISKSKDTKIYKNNLKKKIISDSNNNTKEKNLLSEIKSKSKFTSNNTSKYDINLNSKILSSIFDFNFDNSISPPQLHEEQILSFQKFSNTPSIFEERNKTSNIQNEKFSPLSQICSKFLINDMHKSLYDIINIIIKIQSHFRAFEVKKKLLKNYLSREYIKKKSILKIICIQKIVRSFLAKINVRKKLIIELINKKRKKSIELIIKKFNDFLSVIKVKKELIINYCLEQRKINAKIIQESFRNYLFYKSFKKLRQSIEVNYFLDYPFNANKVDILLYENNNSIKKKQYKKFSFSFNKLLNYFILLINPNQIFSGKYKCQFVVNDIIICDNRYPTIKRKNQIFNIIYLIPKNKKITYKVINKRKNDDNNNQEEEKIEEEDKNKNDENDYRINHYLKKSLEDIMEDEDENKSMTSSSKDYKYEKMINEISDRSLKFSKKDESEDDDDLELYSYEEYLKLKYIKK